MFKFPVSNSDEHLSYSEIEATPASCLAEPLLRHLEEFCPFDICTIITIYQYLGFFSSQEVGK